MKDADVTHNHPLGTPPSPEDLYLLVNNGAKSFRTCGKNGSYVLEYNEAIKKLPDFDSFSLKYDEFIELLKADVVREFYNGSNDLGVLVRLGETVWDELYKLYGVKPRFERW